MKNKSFKNLIVAILLAFVMVFSWGCEQFPQSQLPPETPPEIGSETSSETLENEELPTKYYGVSVHYNNGQENGLISVEKGKTFSAPSDPVKENYLFLGWYSSPALTNKYDFSKPVSKNLDIYAGYEIDGKTVTNAISTDKIKSVVKIYNKSYNKRFGVETGSSTSQGSGFCFAVNNGTYYFLTNCHVAKKESGFSYQTLVVEDYKGNQYQASLYNSAISADYDLACISITVEETDIKVLDLAQTNLEVGDDLIVTGAPQGQTNCITFGNAEQYTTISLSTEKELSNITFPVIETRAYANHGSSGGPVLNSKLEVCGLLFAGNASSDKAYIIPIEKVHEFLTTFVYNN